MALSILAFAGSLRTDSFNRKLVALAAGSARARGAEVDLLDLREVAMPLYDGDLEAQGVPPGAVELRRRIAAASALIIASPEYNASIPGVLKNAIDWSSRPPSPPWRGKIALLLAASPGAIGGARMLPDLRKVLSSMGVLVIPSNLALGRAGEAFDESGRLKSDAVAKDLDRMVGELVDLGTRLAPAG